LKLKYRQKGFTTTQLLIVIIIAVIVVAVILAPRLIGQRGRMLHAKSSEQIEKIGIALDTYAKDNGVYPSSEQGLKALWEKPEQPPYPINWVSAYLDEPIIEDPWGNDYIYICPGIHDEYGYDLISFGSDGCEGGSGDAEDIVSWIRPGE